MKDKRVAVIGTGASAIQFVPAIADTVAELTVIQRTPPWILPSSIAASATKNASGCATARFRYGNVEPGCSGVHEKRAKGFLGDPGCNATDTSHGNQTP